MGIRVFLAGSTLLRAACGNHRTARGRDEAEVAGGDHAAIYLDHCVVRWLMELIGFPAKHSTGMR
jgi:hypothetical protein